MPFRRSSRLERLLRDLAYKHQEAIEEVRETIASGEVLCDEQNPLTELMDSIKAASDLTRRAGRRALWAAVLPEDGGASIMFFIGGETQIVRRIQRAIRFHEAHFSQDYSEE